MKTNRLTALFLALCLTTPLVSCGADPAETTPTAAVDTDTTVATESETQPVDLYADLGSADYNGYDYVILNTEEFKPYMIAEEQNGEIVNDAVFEANAKVMELANLTIRQELVADPNPTFKSCVNAGDNAFDMAIDHDCNSAKRQMSGNYMLNLLELPHIQWDKPWWPQFTTDALTFNDQMYMYSNYSSYLGNWFTRAVFVNLAELRNRNVEDPYQLVYENKWTLDKWIELTKDIYVDLNGDGESTVEDFFGFAISGTTYCWLEAWNIEVFQKDGANIHIDVENERLVNTMEKVYNWFHDNQGVYYSPTSVDNWSRDSYIGIFAAESSMCTYGVIGRLLQGLMDTDIEYGILPMPMLDESVGKYYSGTTDRPVSVPVTCQDKDMVGYVIEAMAISGYEMILPAYCESALKGRYATDEDSTAMLDIIFANRVLGFSYLYNNDNFPQMMNTLMSSKSFDYASYVAKNMSANETWVQKIVDAYAQ